MAEETFSSIGLVEAIERLYEGCPYKAFDSSYFITEGKSVATVKTRTLLEGIDFDLVYFPLTHLGYKSVISVTGELYSFVYNISYCLPCIILSLAILVIALYKAPFVFEANEGFIRRKESK